MDEQGKRVIDQQVEGLYKSVMAYRSETTFVATNEDFYRALLTLGKCEAFEKLVLAVLDLRWNSIPPERKLVILAFFDRERVVKAISDAMDADPVD